MFMDLHSDTNSVDLYDKYEAYLAAPLLPNSSNFNIIKQWLAQEAVWPFLVKIIFDMLTIPAMSAECERVFSSLKLMITDRRNAFKEEVIETNECLRYWYLHETATIAKS